MKKCAAFFLALLLLLPLLCGCGVSSVASRTLLEPQALPQDGILTAEALNALKKNANVGIYTGKCDDIAYTWTVFGDALTTADEQNLTVSVDACDTEHLIFSVDTSVEFTEACVLSLALPFPWAVYNAEAVNEAAEVFPVFVSGSKNTTITLTPQLGKITVTASDITSDAQKSHHAAEEQNIDKSKSFTCTVSVECTTVFNHLSDLDKEKLDILPVDGVILSKREVTVFDGETAFDVLQRVCKENKIPMEASGAPMTGNTYIEGVNNLYEFDCGVSSGWEYGINGWFPNYGAGSYPLSAGDIIEWRYSCELGADISSAITE